jgi:hypothetical protein
MVSLADLVPQSEQVSVRGTILEVRAITAEGLAALIRDFPAGVAGLLEAKTLSAAGLLTEAPKLAAALIAHGLGLADQPDEVKAIEKFGAGDQAALLAAVLRATSPEGIGPFVALIEALGGQGLLAGVKASKVRSTISAQP